MQSKLCIKYGKYEGIGWGYMVTYRSQNKFLSNDDEFNIRMDLANEMGHDFEEEPPEDEYNQKIIEYLGMTSYRIIKIGSINGSM